MQSHFLFTISGFLMRGFFSACHSAGQNPQSGAKSETLSTPAGEQVTLPDPFATKAVRNFSDVIGWGDRKPVAPPGFTVSVFAKDLLSPRWIYQAPNGDIFVSEANTEDKGVTKSVSQFV